MMYEVINVASQNEPATIQLIDNFPGMVIEPIIIPERDFSDFEI